MGVVRKRTQPSLRDCGECPQVCLKRQVGRGSAAMVWGAAASPAGSATLPGCLQLALVTWWQGRRVSAWMRTSTTACPVKAVGPGLTAPARTLVRARGQAVLCTSASCPLLQGPAGHF